MNVNSIRLLFQIYVKFLMLRLHWLNTYMIFVSYNEVEIEREFDPTWKFRREFWMERMTSWITTRDLNLFTFMNRQLQCKFLDVLMPRITHAGGATFCITVLVFCAIFFSDLVRQWSIEAMASLTISHLIVRVIKSQYHRPRPYLTLAHARTFPHPLVDYSFPSGHTTASFSIAVVFALHSPLLASILLPIAFIIGISRMYLGLHYPTDCIIGALIGTVTAIVVYKVAWMVF